ncbi:Rne/Rng family ribonuclease [Dethiothermospora halolimnae]|uniref:Rne/Rng family ribonuclease n=1 Tax=Dethiothermospora halolimnae TaxID=3114390 RepID=UPI003CCBD1C3
MNEIIIDAGLKEDRVAVLEDGNLVELYMERKESKKILGNIYKGRVVNVLPGMQAAFVDIGLEKNAFLYIKDAIPKDQLNNKKNNLKDMSIKDVVKSGQEIIVQVVKEPLGTKGARITRHITLPGRHLVLMPYTNYVGVSRRITKEKERERLRRLVEELKPDNIGVILRTASKGKDINDLKEDITFLLGLFNKIQREKNLGKAPRIIHKDLDLIHKTIRDLFTLNTNRLVINDREKYESIIEIVDIVSPHLKSRVEYFDDSYDIFTHFGVESTIRKSLDRKVWLESGGYIIIDETEALTSIDVNTGKYVGSTNLEDTVVKTNIEATKEIAKQIRLRNIGGIIIIDFIDMDNKEDINLVIKLLEKELKKDRVKTTVLGMTQLGLVEMTRKKVRKRLTSKLLKQCPKCEGTGRIYSDYFMLNKIEREIRRIKNHTNTKEVIFTVSPFVEKMIYENDEEILKEIKNIYEIDIYIRGDKEIDYNEIGIRTIGENENIKEIINYMDK